MKNVVRFWCLAAGTLAVVGCGYGKPARPAGYSLTWLNNSGDKVSNFGVSYPRGPGRIGQHLGDGVWADFNGFGGPPPDRATVFWETPPGTRHEVAVDIAPAVPATTEKVDVYFVLCADGEVEVAVMTHAQVEADDYRALHELWGRGRPADKPYIRQPPR